MGLSGDERWAPWLLDIVLLGGTAETSDQGLRALSTLSGIDESGNVITDFATFGSWSRTEGIDPGHGYEEWKTRLYGWIVGDEYERLLSGIGDPLVLAAIQFGGARRGDIPELNDPSRIPADEATFMTEEELVLGVVLNNVSVAYPVRFLARHELANDHIAGKAVSLVYCTLCRSAILFDRVVGDLVLSFETSGLLLDSNKVMVDGQTDTLWHHLSGTAIAGPLKGHELERFPVETTTWADWLEAHPDTETLDTPPPRIYEDNPERPPLVYDYTPGAAYATYYEADALWFPAVEPPDIYEPKEEVITVALDDAAVAFLARRHHPIRSLGARRRWQRRARCPNRGRSAGVSRLRDDIGHRNHRRGRVEHGERSRTPRRHGATQDCERAVILVRVVRTAPRDRHVATGPRIILSRRCLKRRRQRSRRPAGMPL